MSWRTVVITGITKLDFRMDYMVIRKKDFTNRIHLSEIGLLIIESTTVSLTSMLLAELVKHKIKVIFCDEKHNPHSELLPYYGSHDTSLKVRTQINWPQSIKELIWAEIISEKIRLQSRHLRARGLEEQAELLASYISSIEPGDKTNREGFSAKVYFNALFGMDFTRTQDNSINAALNYGYGIILACFTREIVSNGYITQLGVFHDNVYNQFNLASDLMEPFRILIDKRVYEMMPDKFEQEEKYDILHVLQEQVYIDGKVSYVNNAIKIYTRSIFDAINDNDLSLIRFYQDEL